MLDVEYEDCLNFLFQILTARDFPPFSELGEASLMVGPVSACRSRVVLFTHSGNPGISVRGLKKIKK